MGQPGGLCSFQSCFDWQTYPKRQESKKKKNFFFGSANGSGIWSLGAWQGPKLIKHFLVLHVLIEQMLEKVVSMFILISCLVEWT